MALRNPDGRWLAGPRCGVVKYGIHRTMAKLGIETAKGVHVGTHCFCHGVTSELLESGTPSRWITTRTSLASGRVASEKFSQRIGQNIAQLESDAELESATAVKTA